MLILPSEILAQLHRHAVEQYPHECCGILLGRACPDYFEILHILPAKNLADPARLHDRYMLDPLAILHADRVAHSQSLDLLGFYHSHPDHPPHPSPTDLAAAWPVYIYLILTITRAGPGDLTAWQLPAENQPMRQIAIRPCVPNPPS